MSGAAPQPSGALRNDRRTEEDRARGSVPRSSPTPGMSVDPADWLLQGGLGLAQLLARYHRHRVHFVERLAELFERGRRVILVGNHALDVIDPMLLLAAVHRRTGRIPRFIGHENGWFRLPVIRDFSRHFQVIPSRTPPG